MICVAPADGWRQFEMRRETSNAARGHFTGTLGQQCAGARRAAGDRRPPPGLQEPEVDFDGRRHRHGLAVLGRRFELPLADGLQSVLVQPEAHTP